MCISKMRGRSLFFYRKRMQRTSSNCVNTVGLTRLPKEHRISPSDLSRPLRCSPDVTDCQSALSNLCDVKLITTLQ